MIKTRSRWLPAFILSVSILFAGCSQLQPTDSDEFLESEALVYDWKDTSRNRGPINSSGSLGTMRWASANNGLGPVERNTNNGNRAAGDGRTMVMKRGVYAGQTFTQGLGVYANSSVTYVLNGRCNVFTTHYGLDQTASSDARVAFQIFTDGRRVFDSRDGNDFRLEMGVANVNRLTLRVLDLNPAAKNKSANWGDASLSCNP